jgi:hypothetical protein
MPERLAKDVMVPLERYATVYEDQSLKEALDVLHVLAELMEQK